MGLLISLAGTALRILELLIIIRVVISWIRPNHIDPKWKKVLAFIYNFTEPVLGPIRRLLPTNSIGIDFSPFIALIAIMIIRNFLYGLG